MRVTKNERTKKLARLFFKIAKGLEKFQVVIDQEMLGVLIQEVKDWNGDEEKK